MSRWFTPAMLAQWFDPTPPTPRDARPWAPLDDAEWAVVAPYFQQRGPGRPIRNLRYRVNCTFEAVTSGQPWTAFTADDAFADTIHRQFRRWAHAGLWTRLLEAVADAACDPVLRGLADWICAAYRRAARILGLLGIAIARRLGMVQALRAPAALLPDPDLSERYLRRLHDRLCADRPPPRRAEWRAWLKVIRRYAVPRRIPRCLLWP